MRLPRPQRARPFRAATRPHCNQGCGIGPARLARVVRADRGHGLIIRARVGTTGRPFAPPGVPIHGHGEFGTPPPPLDRSSRATSHRGVPRFRDRGRHWSRLDLACVDARDRVRSDHDRCLDGLAGVAALDEEPERAARRLWAGRSSSDGCRDLAGPPARTGRSRSTLPCGCRRPDEVAARQHLAGRRRSAALFQPQRPKTQIGQVGKCPNGH